MYRESPDFSNVWHNSKLEDLSNVALESTEELREALGSFQWAADAVEKHAKMLLNPERSIEDKAGALQELKIMLCCNRDHVFPIAQDVIDLGGLDGLLQLCGDDNCPNDIRVSAAFCLTNIAAGTDVQTNALVEHGAIPIMLKLLETDDESLRRQALFCLANIAGSTSEVRCKLIRSPMYLTALKFAMKATRDVKIEELAGWNIRNTVVLGGPTFEESIPAIDLFIDHIAWCSPLPKLASKLIQTGAASITAVTQNTPHWTKFGPPDINASYTGVSSHFKPVFRYAAEILCFVSRTSQGRQYLHTRNVYIYLLYLAKFAFNPTVRSYCLEAAMNMCSHGDHAYVRGMVENGAIPALAELLADGFTYSPHQRTLAAKCLWLIATTADSTEIAMMAERVTITINTVLASRRDTLELVEFTPTDKNSETCRELCQDFVETDMPMKCEKLSVLEIAYEVYAEVDCREELGLREKCARIIVAVLSKACDRLLAKYVCRPFVELFIKLMELASITDSNNMTLSEASEWRDVSQALKLSETCSHPAVFTTQCLVLLQRIIEVGENLRLQCGAIDNLFCPLLKHDDGAVRLENSLSCGSLPSEVHEWAFKLIAKYA